MALEKRKKILAKEQPALITNCEEQTIPTMLYYSRSMDQKNESKIQLGITALRKFSTDTQQYSDLHADRETAPTAKP